MSFDPKNESRPVRTALFDVVYAIALFCCGALESFPCISVK